MTRRLWGRASSVNVQKVLWTLDELALDHERIDAGGRYGRTDTDAFARLNPNRRVPVLEHDGFVLWESHAIMRHLADVTGGLGSDRPQLRARSDQWMEFTSTTLQPPFLALFWQMVRLPPERREPSVLTAEAARLGSALRILDGRLSEVSWLAGDDFTLADIAAGSLMHRITDLGLAEDGLGALHRWHRALSARAGYRAHVATSYEELRGA